MKEPPNTPCSSNCDICRELASWLDERLLANPERSLPQLLATVISHAALGLFETVGIDMAARFLQETAQQIAFIETIEALRNGNHKGDWLAAMRRSGGRNSERN